MATPATGTTLIAQITHQAIPPGAVGVWWLGQSSLVLKAAGEIIYVDPYLSPGDRRLTPPACAPDEVTNATLVVPTHDHLDHVDPSTLPALAAASPQARFVAPLPVADRVADLVGATSRVVPASVGAVLTVGAVKLVPIPAKHEEFDLHPTLGYPYLGYLLRVGGLTIYNAGDTIPFEGLVETSPHTPSTSPSSRSTGATSSAPARTSSATSTTARPPNSPSPSASRSSRFNVQRSRLERG